MSDTIAMHIVVPHDEDGLPYENLPLHPPGEWVPYAYAILDDLKELENVLDELYPGWHLEKGSDLVGRAYVYPIQGAIRMLKRAREKSDG